MRETKLWQFPVRHGSLSSRLCEALRVRLNHKLVNYLTRKVVQNKRSKVLEAGCGTASASSLFARHPEVFSVALDTDRVALQEALRRTQVWL